MHLYFSMSVFLYWQRVYNCNPDYEHLPTTDYLSSQCSKYWQWGSHTGLPNGSIHTCAAHILFEYFLQTLYMLCILFDNIWCSLGYSSTVNKRHGLSLSLHGQFWMRQLQLIVIVFQTEQKQRLPYQTVDIVCGIPNK